MISDLAHTECSRFVLPEREEERVDLRWVLKVFTESEMLRSGFADGESESSLKDGKLRQQSGGSGSPASLRALCCP